MFFFLDRISVKTHSEIISWDFQKHQPFCPSKIRLQSVGPPTEEVARPEPRTRPGAQVEVFNHLRFFRTQFEVGYLLVGEAIIFDQKTEIPIPRKLQHTPISHTPGNANYERNPFPLPVGKGFFGVCSKGVLK